MRRLFFVVALISLLAACGDSPKAEPLVTATHTPTPSITSELSVTSTASATSTPQPHRSLIAYGPEREDFLPSINPLTGRAVSDVSLLDLPAVLVSISNMPVTARPQAGPGFAPWVFELYIGEGATRFMNVFYGEYPRFIPNVTGDCEVRETMIRPVDVWLGNRVWLDENENGKQDDWEMGVGGICVNLLSESGELLKTVSTDSNGFYAFETTRAKSYVVEFVLSKHYRFTTPNIDDEDQDSDADPDTGKTQLFALDSTAPFFDAGLILSDDAPVATPSIVPPNWFIPDESYVGPVRSGRLTYNQIGRLFPNSCLVYASAAWDIGERLDACEIVFGVDKTTPNSALLKVTRLRELAEANLNARQPVNYSGNLFSETMPSNGQLANTIRIHYHAYTQSGWEYDPISQTYLRYTDQADGNGSFIPALDRLTGRQMAFENVVVLFADHERFRHNQLEIDLSLGQKGFAYLFRDGQMFKVQWSTLSREWEQTTGLMRPIHFVDTQNNLIPLHPGRTWIHLVTPYSSVVNQSDSQWLMQFVQPDDPLDTPSP